MSVMVDVDTTEVDQGIRDAQRKAPRIFLDVHRRIGQVVHRKAHKNAPISPSKGQLSANLSRGAVKRGASVGVRFNQNGKISITGSTLKTKRKGRPGALARSIDVYDVTASSVTIGVPLNSNAGKYGNYIENQGPRGSAKWSRRGLGTRAKGPQAGDKFLARALDSAMGHEVPRIIEGGLDEMMKGF